MARLRNSASTCAGDFDASARRLASQCDVMAALYRVNGAPPARRIKSGFSGLAQIICGQQVSAASAAAIWRRVAAGLKPLTPRRMIETQDVELASLGLSKPKIKTLKSLALAIESGALDISALNRADDDVVIAQLTALHGIGPWTADSYLLFALQRPDAFPVGDLALRLAADRLFPAEAPFSDAGLQRLAECWRPARALAARMLWHDYGLRRAASRASAVET